MPSNTRCRHGLECNKNKKKRQFENKKFSDHEAKNGFYRIHIVGMYGLDCQKKKQKQNWTMKQRMVSTEQTSSAWMR